MASSQQRSFELLAKHGSRRIVWLGFPILIYAGSLVGPFVFDDLILVRKAERYHAGQTPQLDLFRFAPTPADMRKLIDSGNYPWWSSPEKRIDFFRPLAEWSFYADFLMFGRNAFGHRAVSLLWFALALLAVHRLFASTGADPARCGVATLFVGISQCLTQPATFVSNRADLFVIIGAAIAGKAWFDARKQTGFVPVVLAVLGCAIALLAKENGVALAILFILSIRGPGRRSPGTPRLTNRQAAILLIVLAMSAVYLAFYLHTRRESLHSGGDKNTLEMAESFGLYMAVWLLGLPINALLLAGPSAICGIAVLGVIFAAWFFSRWRRERTSEPARFFLCWTFAFLLPALLAQTETRSLAAATVGWAFILADFLLPISIDDGIPPNRLRNWLLFSNGAMAVACAIMGTVLPIYFEKDFQSHLRSYLAQLQRPLNDGDRLIVKEPASPLEFICAGDRLEFLTGRENVRMTYLTMTGTNAKILPLDDHALRLTSTGQPLLGGPLQGLTLGKHWKPEIGQRFELTGMTLEVTGVNAAGVSELTARFDEPLASPQVRFIPPLVGKSQ